MVAYWIGNSETGSKRRCSRLTGADQDVVVVLCRTLGIVSCVLLHQRCLDIFNKVVIKSFQ